MILLDTNVIVASLNLDASRHRECRAVVDAAIGRRLPGVVFARVLLEAYAVVTDSRRVRKAVAPEPAWNDMEALAHSVPVIYPQRNALNEFARVVRTRPPKGQDAFDAFIVAQMRAAGVGSICTLDSQDFVGYEGVSSETPDATLQRFGLVP